MAAIVLYRILRDLDFADWSSRLKATDRHDIVVAAAFVAAGYFTLTFYDLFALRTIGRADVPLPGRRARRLHQLFGRAQCRRQRLHRRRGALPHLFGQGLSAIEVAKICFVAGLTFWLGNATVLGLGIAYAPPPPSAIDQLPPWLNRVGALSPSLGVLAALCRLGLAHAARSSAATTGR